MNSADSAVIKEGVLKKWTNYVKGYQKRYFVLQKDMLVYYSTKGKHVETPKKIHLKCATITPNRDDTIKINTGTHKFNLKFGSIGEKVEWTNALRITQAKYDDEVNETSFPTNEIKTQRLQPSTLEADKSDIERMHNSNKDVTLEVNS